MTVAPSLALAALALLVAVSAIVQRRAWRRRERVLVAQVDAALAVAARWEAIAGEWKTVARQFQQSSETFERTANGALAMVREMPR